MKTVFKSVVKAATLLALLFLCANCVEKDRKEKDEPKPVKAPAQIVPVAEAKTLYENYGKRRKPLIQRYEDSINSGNGIEEKFDVARYVQYDYQVIKQYIDYIEQEAKAAKVDIASLRIYFSNYPDSDPDLKHPRQNSVLLSPTTSRKGREYLFYISDSINEAPKAVLLNSDFAPLGNDKMGALFSDEQVMQASSLPSLVPIAPNKSILPFQDIKSLTLNRGNSAPPPYQ